MSDDRETVYIRADELRAWLKDWRARDDHNGTGMALAAGLMQLLKASLAAPTANVQPAAADTQTSDVDPGAAPAAPTGDLEFHEETGGE